MTEPIRLDYAVNDAEVIRAFKAQQAELEKEKKARQDLQKQINENARAQKEADTEAAASTRLRNAEMSEAAKIIQKLQTPQEKYTANVERLNDLHHKGHLSAEQFNRSLAAEKSALEGGSKAGDSFGGSLAGIATKMTAAVAGFASMQQVISFIKSEYDALIERQGKAADTNISLAAEQEALLMNLGGENSQAIVDKISGLSTKSGVKEENVTRAVNEAMAARGDFAVQDIVDAVGAAAKVRKFAPTELAGLAAATIDTRKQTGLGNDEALGFLLQMQAQSRTKNLKQLAENFTPAVGGIMQFGGDRQFAGGLLAALSHGMGDPQGAMSATAGIQLAKQLREFGSSEFVGGAAYDQSVENVNSAFASEKQAISMSKEKNKAGLIAAAKARRDEKLKQLSNQLPQLGTMEVFQRIQTDPSLREAFFRGKSDGGFGASFEAKALPAIESLLSGGKQAAQFRSAVVALRENPLSALSQAQSDRDLGAIRIGEQDLDLANIADQGRIRDKSGAMSGVVRRRIDEVMQSMPGNSALGNKLRGISQDLQTGGSQSIESGLSQLESMVQERQAGKTDTARGVGFALDFVTPGLGSIGQYGVQRSNMNDPEYKKQTDALEELVVLFRQNVEQNAQKQHAGVVAGQRNNQVEGAR